MLRRSDFIAARYAFSLVFANFGIAIAARMPMMTTTIRSSIRVKPFLFCVIANLLERFEKLAAFELRGRPLERRFKDFPATASTRKVTRLIVAVARLCKSPRRLLLGLLLVL